MLLNALCLQCPLKRFLSCLSFPLISCYVACCITVVMQCIPRHLQLTIVESALCCPCLEPLFSLGSQTACTQCTFSTLPGVIVLGTGSQPSYTASSEQAPIHFAAENSISGTEIHIVSQFASSRKTEDCGSTRPFLK